MSPLFNRIHQQTTKMVRVCYTPPAIDTSPPVEMRDGAMILKSAPENRLSVTLVEISENNTQPITSVADAEDQIIELARSSPHVTYDFDLVQGTTEEDRLVVISILINRQANQIACRTRRGAGNVVLVHPRVTALLQKASTSAFCTNEPLEEHEEIVGRWRHVGKINNSLWIYECDAMDPNGILVAYVGPSTDETFDAPGAILEQNGVSSLFVAPDIENTMGNARDYLGYFTLKNC